jgi:hypothetical protein
LAENGQFGYFHCALWPRACLGQQEAASLQYTLRASEEFQRPVYTLKASA